MVIGGFSGAEWILSYGDNSVRDCSYVWTMGTDLAYLIYFFSLKLAHVSPIHKCDEDVKKYQQSAVQALYGFFALGGVLSTFVTRPFLGIYETTMNVTTGHSRHQDLFLLINLNINFTTVYLLVIDYYHWISQINLNLIWSSLDPVKILQNQHNGSIKARQYRYTKFLRRYSLVRVWHYCNCSLVGNQWALFAAAPSTWCSKFFDSALN